MTGGFWLQLRNEASATHQVPRLSRFMPCVREGPCRARAGSGGLEEYCYRVGWMLFQVFRGNSVSFGVEVPKVFRYTGSRVFLGVYIGDELLLAI